MLKFNYKAKNKQGQTITGVVEAKEQQGAARILRERGFLVISLRPKGKSISTEIRTSVFTHVSLADKVNFTRQLATMINAGLKVTDALEILELQSGPAMKQVVGTILRAVEGGGNLTDALQAHPDVFNPIYVALVRSGESAGILDKVLLRLADNMEKQKEFQSKIKGAMIYPIVVISAMIGVAGLMIVFVIPKMTSIYEEFQAELPLPTKILLSVSDFATRFWYLVLLLLLGLAIGIKVALRNPAVRKEFDRIIFRLPVVGKLRQKVVMTEFSRTLGLLIGAGILIVDALEIVRHALGSPIYIEAVIKAGKEVEKGLPLASALAQSGIFPPLLPQMISVGEETGKMDEVLGRVAAYFEQEADAAVKGLTTAVEPLIMIVLGVGVAFLVIAVIMPIYNLTSQF